MRVCDLPPDELKAYFDRKYGPPKKPKFVKKEPTVKVSSDIGKNREQKKHTYVIRLIDNKYYVGATDDIPTRYSHHCRGTATKITKLYPPIEIVETFDADIEPELTLYYKSIYGDQNVWGSYWCQLKHKCKYMK